MLTSLTKKTLCLSAVALSMSLGATALAEAAKGSTLPQGVTARLGTHHFRHTANSIVCVQYIDDGRQLLTVTHDSVVHIWDAATGEEVRRFGPNVEGRKHVQASPAIAPAQSVVGVATLSADNKMLAIGGHDGTIALWDVPAGKLVQKLKSAALPSGYAVLTFAADGKRLLARDQNARIYLWDVAEAKELKRFGEVPDRANGKNYYGASTSVGLALSADGKVVLSAAMFQDGNQQSCHLRRWDVESGKELAPTTGPATGFQSLAFSPDGKIAAWGCNDGSISSWDLATNKELRKFGGAADGGYPTTLSFSPDARHLLTRAYDQTIRIWDVAAGKEVRRVGTPSSLHLHGIYQPALATNIAISADGRKLAVGTGAGTLRQWDATTGKETTTAAGHHGPVLNIGVFMDGKVVATRASDNWIHLWEAGSGKAIRSLELAANVSQVAFATHADVAVIAYFDGSISVWDMKQGKELRQWKTPAAEVTGRGSMHFSALVISPDGKTIASRGQEQVIRLWDAASGKALRTIDEQTTGPDGITYGYVGQGWDNNSSQTLGFSPDGSTLLSLAGSHHDRGGRGRRCLEVIPTNTLIRLWDVSTGKLQRRFELSIHGIVGFSYSPDGRSIAVSSRDATIQLWETASGKCRYSSKPHPKGFTVGLLSYSPDGKTLVGIANGQDPTVRSWDAASGKELTATLKGHASGLASLLFSPDGKILLSGGWDTTALVCDAAVLTKSRTATTAELTDEQVEAAWNDLSSDDARKAYDAVLRLGQAPGQASAWLQKRLKPVAEVDEKRISQLVADLDSPKFGVRQKAGEELEKLGELAGPALKVALADGPALDVRMRVERLLERLATGGSLPPGDLRVFRAVEALELVATVEARQVVESLTKGAAGARLTREAKAALSRLSR